MKHSLKQLSRLMLLCGLLVHSSASASLLDLTVAASYGWSLVQQGRRLCFDTYTNASDPIGATGNIVAHTTAFCVYRALRLALSNANESHNEDLLFLQALALGTVSAFTYYTRHPNNITPPTQNTPQISDVTRVQKASKSTPITTLERLVNDR